MTERRLAIAGLILLGAGLLALMGFMVTHDNAFSADDGGWIIAAFLSLREVFGKVETITLGREPRAPEQFAENANCSPRDLPSPTFGKDAP